MPDKSLMIPLDEIRSLGEIFVKSGFFSDSRDASQAIVKILCGRELGFAPIAAMMGVNIIQGKPTLSANLMATKVKGSGKYDYRVLKQENDECQIEFFQKSLDGSKWESLGISKFTLEDAKKAGTKNLDRYPRNMLFARTMSNGVKWYCPDATNGVVVYEPTELGGEVDEDGNLVIEGQSTPVPPQFDEFGHDDAPIVTERKAEIKEAIKEWATTADGKKVDTTTGEVQRNPTQNAPLSEHEYGGTVIAWKNTIALTKKDKPTIEDIYKVDGTKTLTWIAEGGKDDDGKTMKEIRAACRAFLDGLKKETVIPTASNDPKELVKKATELKKEPSKKFDILSKNWSPFAKEVAEQDAYYMANGTPDTYHMIGALKKMGFDHFDDENAEELKLMLHVYAAEKEQEVKPKTDEQLIF